MIGCVKEFPKQILVLAPHPDDEVLGCGGTIARHIDRGDHVTILFFTDGVGGREKTSVADATARTTSRDKALKILGVQKLIQRQFPDNRLDTVPLLKLAQTIEHAAANQHFSTVYCPFGGDLNIDHQRVFEATLTAFRPIKPPHSNIYSYAIASSTEWSPQAVFKPTAFVDISKYLEKKIQAMETYQAELRSLPHPRSPEVISATAKYWGSISGLLAAEPFQIIRSYLS